MIGVAVAQLYRLQHSSIPSPVFGYYVLSKPIAALFQCSALGVTLIGAVRFYRQQHAMAIGKVHAGGWEISLIGALILLVSRRITLEVVGVELL